MKPSLSVCRLAHAVHDRQQTSDVVHVARQRLDIEHLRRQGGELGAALGLPGGDEGDVVEAFRHARDFAHDAWAQWRIPKAVTADVARCVIPSPYYQPPDMGTVWYRCSKGCSIGVTSRFYGLPEFCDKPSCGARMEFMYDKVHPWLALPFGTGAALIVDETALLIELEDVYWSDKGGLSVDVAFGATTLLALLALVSRLVRRGEAQVLDQRRATP